MHKLLHNEISKSVLSKPVCIVKPFETEQDFCSGSLIYWWFKKELKLKVHIFITRVVTMLWILLQIAIASIIFVLGLTYHMYSNDEYWPRHGVPFVKPSDIGSIWQRMFLLIPLHKLDGIIYKKLRSYQIPGIKYGGIMEYRRPVAFLMDLELIKLVTVKDFDNFVNRRGMVLNENDPTLFHKMLFNIEGQKWKDLRSAMTPAFSTGKIRKIFHIITTSADRMIKYAREEAKCKTELDIGDICGRFTMDVIANSAFGVDSNNFVDRNSKFAIMAHLFSNQFDGFGGIKLLLAIWFPVVFRTLKLHLLDINAVRFFGQVTKDAIEHRKRTGTRRNDFLQLLLDARAGQLREDDEDEKEQETFDDKISKLRNYKASAVEFTDELILAQSLLFFLAGFDTAETLMQFTLYELAINPAIQERLAAEIEQATESEEGLTYDAINTLPYLDMVTAETLRMYPPSTRAERRCLADYRVPGSAPIEKGTVVVIPIMQIHHDPNYYPYPEKFDPDRFSPENKAKRNPYCYMPFGVGPRSCIARRFAYTESKCAIAHLVHNFVIEPCEKTQIPMEIKWNLIIKPKNGMWLKLGPRRD